MYITDGAYFFSFITYVLNFGNYGWHTLLGCLICVVFIGGNIAFLRAVRNKYAIGVRTAIIANAMFVVVMTAILILWLIVRADSTWKIGRFFTFIFRVLILVVLCGLICGLLDSSRRSTPSTTSGPDS